MAVPYFDAHCDTIVASEYLRVNAGQLDLTRLSAYRPAAQIFAVCTPEDFPGGYRQFLPRLVSELEENRNLVTLCRSAGDIRQSAEDGKIAALIAIEGAEHFGCSIDGLHRAYELGVRSVNLTWNFDNALAGAAMDSGKGLTEQGRTFVREAQEMGVMMDLSHASERTFWDTLAIAEKPVYATHSDAMAPCHHLRNLTDAQFQALARTGGGAGVNLYPEFLGLTRDLDAVIAHIEHFLALGGEQAVFLGTDFDGIDQTPEGLNGVEDMERLYDGLLRRNYPEQLVQDIFYNNLLNILEGSL